MTQLMDRARQKRRFSDADILSQLGETIFVADVEHPTVGQRSHPHAQRVPPKKVAVDEEPERWDGLA
jgi:hypothetical protein